MSIPFKGDIAADRKHRKLSSTMSRTYSTAKHVMHFTSVPIFSFRLKDRLSSSAASFCIYQFDCTCGASYIGRTTRRLSERIREHVPASLSRGQTGSNASAIALHLAGSGHMVDRENAFRIVYRVRGKQSRKLKSHILSTAEAICIRLFHLPLCQQKLHVRGLNLNWPRSLPRLVTSFNPQSQSNSIGH